MKFLAAVVQLCSGEDTEQNVDKALDFVMRAARQRAAIIVLPEMFHCYGSREAKALSAESIPGALTEQMGDIAKNLKVVIVAGSFMEKSEEEGRFYNTSCVFGADGALLGKYRKIHLFDADLPDGSTYVESDFLRAGSQPLVANTGLGAIGLAICFDIRFPGLFQTLRTDGASLICLPSAFTFETGKAHWEILVRARAIETQSYLLAANRWGPADGAVTSFGHSMIVDPWGDVLAHCPTGEGVAMAEIDTDVVARVRRRIPVRW